VSNPNVGIVIIDPNPANSVQHIVDAERMGITRAWMTLGGGMPDAITTLSVAAAQTESILLGTCIVPTYPRHPIVMAQQTLVISALAPGRFRLGIGPSHAPTIEGAFGYKMERPLRHLREYVTVLRQGLSEGQMDYNGETLSAHIKMGSAPDVPIIISALRTNAFRLAGEMCDGAVSWVCPLPYLRDVALPAMQAGAAKAGRQAPPLYAHVPVAATTDRSAVHEAAARQVGFYPRLPFYARMFADAGYPEALEGEMSERMVDALVVSGTQDQIGDRFQQFFDAGMHELVVTAIDTGPGSVQGVKEVIAALSH
jgi:F420-dependent oxidoreductase-like protein